MNSRNTRHRLLQRFFWSSAGCWALPIYVALRRRIDYVLFNRSLHTETNGELWLLQQLSERPVVFDVGFNKGDFTAAVLAARPQAQVVAFDPARSAERAWREEFQLDSRVRFVSAALSNTSGEAEFHDYGNMCSSLAVRDDAAEVSTTYTVPVATLDAWCERENITWIDLLKIDAEGYDPHVLEGATRVLAEGRVGLFLFEYADGWIASRRYLRDVMEFVDDKPYRLLRLFNGFLAPFEYSCRQERFDLGRMFVGVAREGAYRDVLVRSNMPLD